MKLPGSSGSRAGSVIELMRTSKVIHVVSCHAEGEVGDVIVGGVAPPPGDTIWEQRCFIEEDDRLRRFVLNEPRGGVFRHVNLLVPLTVDTAYGGDSFVIVDAKALGFEIVPDEASEHQDWREVVTEYASLGKYLRDHGYYSAGSGKIYHDHMVDPSCWDEYWPSQKKNMPDEYLPNAPEDEKEVNGLNESVSKPINNQESHAQAN